jgi:hypothetical protein
MLDVEAKKIGYKGFLDCPSNLKRNIKDTIDTIIEIESTY